MAALLKRKSNDPIPARARNADYCDAYDALPEKYGYTKEQMLVLLKVYGKYVADKESGKSVCGIAAACYEILSSVFHRQVPVIYTDDLVESHQAFWESVNGGIRLSEEGRAFVKDTPKLLESATCILPGVVEC